MLISNKIPAQHPRNYKGKRGLEVVRKVSTWRGGGSISLSAYLEAGWMVKERIMGNVSAFGFVRTPPDSTGLLFTGVNQPCSLTPRVALIHFHHSFILKIIHIMTAKTRQLVSIF